MDLPAEVIEFLEGYRAECEAAGVEPLSPAELAEFVAPTFGLAVH